MGLFEVVALVACNVIFLGLVAYIVFRSARDKFVTYFLGGEYLVAMFPISIIGILEPQTATAIVAIFLIHIALLIILGVLPKYFRAPR